MKYLLYFFLLNIINTAKILAVPVIPNFGSGQTQSTTEVKYRTVERIESFHFNTGYTFNQSGSNIKVIGSTLTPETINTQPQTVNGISSTWKSIDLNTKPQYEQVIVGAGTQYNESLMGPGLAEHVIIDRTVDVESITNSVSIYTN